MSREWERLSIAGESVRKLAPAFSDATGSLRSSQFVRGVITTDAGIVTLLALDCVLPPAEELAA